MYENVEEVVAKTERSRRGNRKNCFKQKIIKEEKEIKEAEALGRRI